MVRGLVLLLVPLSVAACGKELNPKFCAAHPDDPRCADEPDAAAAIDAAAECPADYTIVLPSQPSRYRFDTSSMDWLTAITACSSNTTTHLAVISNAAERIALDAIVDTDAWISLNDRLVEGTYVDVTDEVTNYPEIAALTQPPWEATEPDSSGDCVLLTSAAELHDRDCASGEAVLCECDAYVNDPTNY